MFIPDTVTTKARPTKKLCILDKDDHTNLQKIIKSFSSEIGGFLNLILINDSDLFSENTIEFINYHDPDIIVNFSSCENKNLSLKFNTLTIEGKENILHELSMPLIIFNNLPGFAKTEFEKVVGNVFTRFDKEANLENYIYYVNFGLIEKEFKKNKKESFFENIYFQNLNSISKFFEILFNHHRRSLLFVSRVMSSVSESVNIWNIDHNKENYYNKIPTVIFGSNNNIKSIVYFWNVRATYTHNINVWLPLELFENYRQYLNRFSNFCIFPDKNYADFKTKVIEANNNFTEIDNTKFYFNSKGYEWDLFKHPQNGSIINKKFTIIHPREKLFSYGFNYNIILEISGLDELLLPKSFKLGELFKNSTGNNSFSPSFSRISPGRLMFSFNSFERFGVPYIDKINIPDVITIFEAIFKEHGLKLKNTQGTQITEQLINMIGGCNELGILCDKNIFELLIVLTPKRIQRLVKDITKDLHEDTCVTDEKITELIEKNIRKVNTLSSNIIVEAQNLATHIHKVQNKENFYSSIQKLYEKNILLRGKSFKCPLCESSLWYPLSSIKDDIKCYCCNNFINIPIFSGSKILTDSFRLNELVITSVDQGVLPVLLTTNFLYKQRFSEKRFIFDYNVLENSKPIAEIDIIFTLGARVGLAEVKADRGFDKKQADKLLDIAQKINADMVLFSTLLSADSEEIKEFYDYITTKNLSIPSFILTEKVLFERKLVDLSKYFRINHNNTFSKGAIILTND